MHKGSKRGTGHNPINCAHTHAHIFTPKLVGETHTHIDMYTVVVVKPTTHGEGEGAYI